MTSSHPKEWGNSSRTRSTRSASRRYTPSDLTSERRRCSLPRWRRPELFRSLVVGAGASTYPLVVEGNLKSMIEAETLPPLNAGAVIDRFLGSIRGDAVRRFVRDDYLASYEGDRLTRSAAFVRAYPNDLAALAPRLASIEVPVAIVVGRNDPYGLARDAALLRERLPHARLDVLEAGHCVWEERAPEFESIVTQWVRGGFSSGGAR